jgi:hypothetical protein
VLQQPLWWKNISKHTASQKIINQQTKNNKGKELIRWNYKDNSEKL